MPYYYFYCPDTLLVNSRTRKPNLMASRDPLLFGGHSNLCVDFDRAADHLITYTDRVEAQNLQEAATAMKHANVGAAIFVGRSDAPLESFVTPRGITREGLEYSLRTIDCDMGEDTACLIDAGMAFESPLQILHS